VQIIFWTSIFFIFYAYLGYPLLLVAFSVFRKKPVKKGNITPSVSIIITAYNEALQIREKITNTIQLDYPKDRLEIIVASDCSSDGTDEIVKSFEPEGVRLVRAPERKGKEAAQKLAVDSASGEIFAFSDVATMLPSDGIANIVKNFHDPTVGCVSSEDRLVDPGGKISGEGAYVKYEMFIRKLETNGGTMVGLSGSFFAARREVCQDWAVDLQSDFNTLLNTVKKGLRGVSDPDSVGYYKNIVDESKEFERKVRTVLRGIVVFMETLPMLNPFRYGLFSWQLFSHKLCRWLVPFAMILVFSSNVCLIYSKPPFYFYIFVLQLAFYMIACGGIWTNLFVRNHITRNSSFLVLVNLAILRAWYQYAQGARIVSWKPSTR